MRSSFTIFLVAPRTRPTKGGSIAVALGTLACGAKLYRYAEPSPQAVSLRAASDALPARHCLSWRPCHSPVSQLTPQYNFLRQRQQQ